MYNCAAPSLLLQEWFHTPAQNWFHTPGQKVNKVDILPDQVIKLLKVISLQSISHVRVGSDVVGNPHT